LLQCFADCRAAVLEFDQRNHDRARVGRAYDRDPDLL
jgi:hypothetical protein